MHHPAQKGPPVNSELNVQTTAGTQTPLADPGSKLPPSSSAKWWRRWVPTTASLIEEVNLKGAFDCTEVVLCRPFSWRDSLASRAGRTASGRQPGPRHVVKGRHWSCGTEMVTRPVAGSQDHDVIPPFWTRKIHVHRLPCWRVIVRVRVLDGNF